MGPTDRVSRKLRIAFAVAVVLLTLVAACVWFVFWRETGPIPRKYTQGLNIQLYYPTRLPEGYWVEHDSFKRQDDVLIFSIKTSDGKNIAVAQQAVPADAPARSKSNAPLTLPGEKDFTAPAGQVHLGLWGDKYVADIISPKGTWIILNATGFTKDEATRVAQSFNEL